MYAPLTLAPPSLAVYLVLWHCAVGYTNQAVGALRALSMVARIAKQLEQSSASILLTSTSPTSPPPLELVVVAHSSILAYNQPLKQAPTTSTRAQRDAPTYRVLAPEDVGMRMQLRAGKRYVQVPWSKPHEARSLLKFAGPPVELQQQAPFCDLFDATAFAKQVHLAVASAAPHLRTTTLAFAPHWLPSLESTRFAVPRARNKFMRKRYFRNNRGANVGVEIVRGRDAWPDCNEIHQCRSPTGDTAFPHADEWAEFVASLLSQSVLAAAAGARLSGVSAADDVGQRAVALPCMFWCFPGAQDVTELGEAAQHLDAVAMPAHLRSVVEQLEGLLHATGATGFVGLHLRREPDMCMMRDGAIDTNTISCLISMQEITAALSTHGVADGATVYVSTGMEVQASDEFKAWRDACPWTVVTKELLLPSLNWHNNEGVAGLQPGATLTAAQASAPYGREELAAIEVGMLTRSRHFFSLSRTSMLTSYVEYLRKRRGTVTGGSEWPTTVLVDDDPQLTALLTARGKELEGKRPKYGTIDTIL